MTKQVQLRRGTTAQLSSVTGAEGEVIVDTTKDTLTVHDGYTAGGVPLLKENLSNLGNNTIGLGKIVTGTQGQVLYYNASGQLTALNPGTSGQFLSTSGSGGNPSWATVAQRIVAVKTSHTTSQQSQSGAQSDQWLSMPGLNAITHTMANANNTIMIFFQSQAYGNATTDGFAIRVIKDGAQDSQGGVYVYGSSSAQTTQQPAALGGHVIFRPADTSSHTYNLQWQAVVPGSTMTINGNRYPGRTTATVMTLMEVAMDSVATSGTIPV